MKTWDGDLSHLNQEEMEIFKHFYKGFQYEKRYDFDTKAQIISTLKFFKECKWPTKVLDIIEFIMYEQQSKNKKELEKWERNMYRRLKRKYG